MYKEMVWVPVIMHKRIVLHMDWQRQEQVHCYIIKRGCKTRQFLLHYEEKQDPIKGD